MKSGVLVIGHGSKLEFNKNMVIRMADILDKKKEFGPAVAVFMQLNEPDIKTGIKSLVEKGVDMIYVQPCFLASGIHIAKDIPEELGFANGENESEMVIDGKRIALRYCGPIGDDPRIAEILADRIRERIKKA